LDGIQVDLHGFSQSDNCQRPFCPNACLKACDPVSEKLKGIFTPNVVPLLPDGQINEPELRRYVDWLIDRGVHGLYPNGSTGEFTRFTVEERRRIIKIVCEQAAPRGVPVLAGAAEANVTETIAACETYHGYGARAVAIVSPIYYRLSSESLYAYFSEIARHSPIDVTLYNIPMLASPIDVPTMRRLAEDCPRIVGVKDSSGDVVNMLRMIAAIRPQRPDFSFLTGWEAALVPMLVVGADGGTHATSGVVPELTRRLYELTCAGVAGGADALRQAVDLQLRLIELFDAMLFGADFPDGFRAAVELRGFDIGRSRQPLTPQQTIDREKLQRQLECIMSDFGVVDPPTGGCASRPSKGRIDLPRELQTAAITDAVMAELRKRGISS